MRDRPSGGRSRSIVYFAFLGDEADADDLVARRLAFMDRQLRWLADLVAATGDRPVQVPYAAPRAWHADVERTVSRHGFRIDPRSIAADHGNTFEYPGFVALKALARASAPDHLIYYCHSKGITGLEETKMGMFKLQTSIGLRADLTPMIATANLTRAGLFPSEYGWVWYNFFWIKAGYMAGLPVEKHADRHLFEALIGERPDKQGFRNVFPLIDHLHLADSGIPARRWYGASETVSPTLFATYDRYAAMTSPPDVRAGARLRPRTGLTGRLARLFEKRSRNGA